MGSPGKQGLSYAHTDEDIDKTPELTREVLQVL
jgi:hypothetical protein